MRTGRLKRKVNTFFTTLACGFAPSDYRAFFRDMGYEDVSYRVIEGRMPCMIAVITKTVEQ